MNEEIFKNNPKVIYFSHPANDLKENRSYVNSVQKNSNFDWYNS